MNSATAVAALVFLVALSAGCGGGVEDDDSSAATSVSGFDITLAGEERLAVGPSRFVFALYDARGRLVTEARANLKLFFIDPNFDDRKTYKTTLEAQPVAFDRTYQLALADGSELTYERGETGIYASQVAFDSPGEWVVEVTGTGGGGTLGVIEKGFSVALTLPGPGVGKAAPLSTPEIEAAVSAAQPAVIVFAEAGFCPSAVCGPVAEIAAGLEEAYADAASFVYVEPFVTDTLPEEPPQPLQWVSEEWAVGSAPVVFVIDSDGIVRARFDVIVSYDELEAALQAVIS